MDAEDVTGDGSVMKTVEVAGEGEVAGVGARVSVRYWVRRAGDGVVVDSSESRRGGVLTFTVGRGRVMRELEDICASMSIGEVCEVVLEHGLGRGGRRVGLAVGNAAAMRVEMVSFVSGVRKKGIQEMSCNERFAAALDYKELGNALFKECKYEKAMAQYSLCIRHLSQVFYKPKPSSTLKDPVAVSVGSDVGTRETVKENNQQGEEKSSDESGFVEAEVTEATEKVQAINVADASQVADVTDEAQVIDVTDEAQVMDVTDEVQVIDVTDEAQVIDVTDEAQIVDVSDEAEVVDGTAKQDDKEDDSNATGSTPPVADDREGEPKAEESAPEEADEPEEAEVRALHVTTLQNLSLCFVKLGDYKSAVEGATLALQMDPESHKALYYR